ncbi:expressed unknown protein [Seminavis robusta]|uniref:Uncharacterized protein n=1 Tax=Seminavis robusta TaxID=568900 RepID=A0A9N8H5Q6_9STRA|nr:expressed unknown protein [Seminavis robusta]|eukprot:Sro92_g048160.1 n/a (395) ;mRNA; f:74234-75418
MTKLQRGSRMAQTSWTGREVVTRLLVNLFYFLLAYECFMLYFEQSAHRDLAATPNLLLSTTARTVGIDVDVLSIGSKSRLDRFQAQIETWARSTSDGGLIRKVYHGTEDDDWDEACRDGSLTTEQAVNVRQVCNKLYRTNRALWYMRRNINLGFLWDSDKLRPGWLCAQKRLVLALARVLRGYNQNNKVPDYLLLVDDDTWYDMDKLVDILRTTNSDSPYVAAGCRTHHSNRHVIYYGGMGLVLSKASLRRMLRPILELPDNANDEWEKHVLHKLSENLAMEKDLHQPGMSLIELMDAYVKAEAYQNANHWERGFCFHSDNFLSFIIEHYRIHETSIMDVLVPEGVFEKHDIVHHGVCTLHANCEDDSMMCHYQTREDMVERTEMAKRARLTVT